MKVLFIFAGLILFAGGCLKVDYWYDIHDNRLIKEAEVIFSGSPEVDGCGWLIRINDNLYHPESLDDVYKVDNLPVEIEYTGSREIYRCGRGGTPFSSIRILRIETLKKKRSWYAVRKPVGYVKNG